MASVLSIIPFGPFSIRNSHSHSMGLSKQDAEGFYAVHKTVLRYLDLGFQGFRCDAAYQVPAALWRVLIHEAQKVNPNAVFWAENLGCTPDQTRALRAAGFHFFCNSSKWWNFQDAWCPYLDLPSLL